MADYGHGPKGPAPQPREIPMKILVVDDESIVLESCKRVLEDYFDVIPARSADAALEVAILDHTVRRGVEIDAVDFAGDGDRELEPSPCR